MQKLIHQLKYKGRQDIGKLLGIWFGRKLKESREFSDIDYIIPVPLHPRKLRKRGYNQLTTFGENLSNILNITYKTGILIKANTSKTQTYKNRFDRFFKSNSNFKITNTSFLENKQVLLIDDVITTGATLASCCIELSKNKKHQNKHYYNCLYCLKYVLIYFVYPKK